MTPKEKAKELVGKFYTAFPIDNNSLAKQCALIAVHEIINTVLGNDWSHPIMDFWTQVNEEIEKL